MYSLIMSFCTVPDNSALGILRSSATATYKANSVVAGALIVIEVETWLRSIPSKRILIS